MTGLTLAAIFRRRDPVITVQTEKVTRRNLTEIVDAYTEGVNDGLAALGSAPFEYALLLTEPEPWLPEDTALAPTRSQLIAKGMIWSPTHGDTAFTVPLFDEFMRRMMPGDDWRE